MAQELISNKTIAIVGAGPAGCFCAKLLLDYGCEVTLFDKWSPLRTILPTGGGRCNLAHSEFDFKELAKNYPRGEKFLYSVFSKFSTENTLNFFDSIGVKTYTQDDNRIFPTSNSSKEVQEKILSSIKDANIIKEDVQQISKLDNCYKIKTNKSSYAFDIVVVSIGGHSKLDILSPLDLRIEPQTQALVALKTQENFADISGVSIKNVKVLGKDFKQLKKDDIIFTHKGISGPLIYKISSIYARKEMPYKLTLQLIEPFNLQEELDKNPHKEIKNLVGNFVPKSFANCVLKSLEIPLETSCCKINGKIRDKILNKLTNFEINIVGKVPDSEVVTCGGISLKEIDSKTMEAKRYPNLYFCGEVLDVDGFCGGFNLQNCWSTAYIAAQGVRQCYRSA